MGGGGDGGGDGGSGGGYGGGDGGVGGSGIILYTVISPFPPSCP